jgi:polyhydroxyalkanoate synthase
VNYPGLTWPVDTGRWALSAAGEAVDAAAQTPETLEWMLDAGVGETDSEVVYEENKLELHHYEPESREHETPILFVYSLVNRPFVVDLQPDRSVLRRLLEQGFPVYVVEWGEPSALDRHLDLADYVTRYLDNCVDAACADAGVERVHMLGYCMGGTMAVMYASRYGERLQTLGLMATPVAFDDTGGVLERWANDYDADQAVATYGNMPAELLTYGFTLIDPVQQYVTKYVRLYDNLDDREFVEKFARMERWSFDGVDLAGEAYREFIEEIYKDNALVRGEYHLGDHRVDLGDIDVPVLQLMGEYDHLVPNESSLPLTDAVGSDDVHTIQFSTGHIGLSISSYAQVELWPEVGEWFAERDATDEPGTGETDAAEESPADHAGSDAAAAPDGGGAAARVEAVEAEAAEAVRAGENGVTTEGTPDEGSATGRTDPVETVDGIGPTYAERLRAAGIETVADLSGSSVDRLAEAAEAPPGRVEGWLSQVRP